MHMLVNKKYVKILIASLFVSTKSWWRQFSSTVERLHFHFSLLCIGDGNGNPLQCSCLENPRDRVAWWAAVYRVAQSRTRLKWLSRSSRDDKLWYIHWMDCHRARKSNERLWYAMTLCWETKCQAKEPNVKGYILCDSAYIKFKYE